MTSRETSSHSVLNMPPPSPSDTPHKIQDRFGSKLEHLDWIDEFVANIRPYVSVRLEDNVLIKIPLEVYQVNKTGIQILHRALEGERARDVALAMGADTDPQRIYVIHQFFCDIRDLLSKRLGDASGRAATRVTHFEGSFTRYPVLSEIALTYRCNLACQFCYAHCGTATAPTCVPKLRPGLSEHGKGPANRTRTDRSGEMSTQEILTVIDRIATDAKVPSVSFTGGEPSLREDLPQFIQRARERDMRVNLITNGLACASRDFVKELSAAGLNSAQVSLEGHNSEIHDGLTQRQGAFEKAIQGIRNLKEAGIHVHTNTTVCKDNIEHLAKIVDRVAHIGLERLSMNQIIPTGRPAEVKYDSLLVSYSDIGKAILETRDHAEQAGISFHWYSPIPFCIFNPIAHGLGNKGCAACDGLLHVAPNGDILPCSSLSKPVGNILRKDFSSIWFGRKAQYYKKKRMPPLLCKTCEYFALCQGACILYWKHFGLHELYRANGGRFRCWAGNRRSLKG